MSNEWEGMNIGPARPANRSAVTFVLLNEDRAELLRAEDDIRGLLTGFFGFTEVSLPTAEQSADRGEQIRSDKIIAAWRRKTDKGDQPA